MNAPTDEHGYQQWQPPVPGPVLDPAQPQPSGFRYLWNHPVVIAGVMGLLLLMVTAISIIAIKAVGNDSGPGDNTADPRDEQTNQQANQVPPATGGATGGTPPASQPAGTPSANSAPAVNSTNAVYLNGKLKMQYYDSGIDLDTAKTSGLGTNEKYDFDVTETGLTAVNRAQAGTGAAAGAPTPAGCTAASVKWGTTAHISVLLPGATICVKTSDDRLGALTVANLDKSDDGQMRTLEVDYVIWKKQGDA
ncbi:hypothetical protein [Virgisporangium ochraceum]|uniref:Uncharacterized protein n=1 Tax=Virgisporangium ochraceum TaxID=65505 RepID=A0A8J4A316_9ACTN|nr:hypothetical protein [Virgisporangium ochraceum]GIJ74206.1 hypothetical protein Voc01_091230 [Virgisporangium ochraceum]